MPVYKLQHDCGFEQEFFLHEDKETIIVPCQRCRRNVTARQVRDKSLKFGEADGVIGVLKKEKDAGKRDRRR